MNMFLLQNEIGVAKKNLFLTFFSIEIFFDFSIKLLNIVCPDQS